MTGRIVDVNVNLGQWPTRRALLDDPARLVAKLREHKVAEAWVGAIDGLWHKDLGAVNARLAADCRAERQVRLVPFGSVNPALPDWEEDLRRCAEDLGMPGLRLHPNYHGYALDDPRFSQLLSLAAERGLVVELAVQMEDRRMMHPMFQVSQVDPAPLAELVSRTEGLRLVLLNALNAIRGEGLRSLIDAGEVFVEIGMLEGAGGVGTLLEQVPSDRVLFGSHAPLFTYEAAVLKLRESPLDELPLRAIQERNARRLLPPKS